MIKIAEKCSKKKPSNQDPHCFPLKIHVYHCNAAGIYDKNWEGV